MNSTPPLRRVFHLALVLVALNVHLVSAVIGRMPPPRTVFRTEPLFEPSRIAIKNYTDDDSLFEPGYIFIAPHISLKGWGPQIFAQNGDLVWYGQPWVGQYDDSGNNPAMVMNFHVCDHLGQLGNHLCWTEVHKGHMSLSSTAINRQFDARYIQVGPKYGKINEFSDPNPHEFNVLSGGASFAQSVYRPKRQNLAPYHGRQKGWVLDGCFQEVAITTSNDTADANELFQWCYLDHLPLWHTQLYLDVPENLLGKGNATAHFAGVGKRLSPWDFMHINSIDKNEEGDFLVSGRFINQIIKIAGLNNRQGIEPGKVIWAVGGPDSDFDVRQDAAFSMQGHARFVSTGPKETIISIFDNAFNGQNKPSALASSAKFLIVSNDTKTVEVQNEYTHPNKYLVHNQGSTQLLKNDNVFVGWGTYPEWSEYARDGRILSHGKIVVRPQANGKLHQNYRTFKSPWVGRPYWPPRLLVYSQTCQMNFNGLGGSPLMAYVSWNGATDVHSWRFRISAATIHGPWIDAGTVGKSGFETTFQLRTTIFHQFTFARYASVQAIGADGSVLSTAYAEAFVPKVSIRDRCDEDGCNQPRRFLYGADVNRAASCGITIRTNIPAIILLVLFLVGVELLDYYVMQRAVGGMVELERLRGRRPSVIDAIKLNSGRAPNGRAQNGALTSAANPRRKDP